MCEQNASLVQHSATGAKKLNKICPKIVQKALEWPFKYVKIQKNFQGCMLPDPLELSLFLNLLQINSNGKNTLEKMSKFGVQAPEKNSECAPDMKHFQRAYLRPFPGLNVMYVFVFG